QRSPAAQLVAHNTPSRRTGLAAVLDVAISAAAYRRGAPPSVKPRAVELTTVTTSRGTDARSHALKTLRVALVTNVIAAYRVPSLRELTNKLGAFRILASRLEMAEGLAKARADDLDLHLMKSLSWRQRARHPGGYVSHSTVFVPLSLLADL